MKSKAEVGIYLRQLRDENLMTQTELARVLNVEPQTVSKWETGSGYPDIALMQQIADYYKITVDDIFECRFPEFRYTKKIVQENINWKNRLLNSLIFDSVEPIYTNTYTKEYPKLSVCKLDETESLQSFLAKTENVLWDFDDNSYQFIDPESKLLLNQEFFKVMMIVRMVYIGKSPARFLINQFKCPFSEEVIKLLAKQNHLKRLFISFMTFEENYAKKGNIDRKEMPTLLHPQFSQMNEFNLIYQHENIIPDVSGLTELIKPYMLYGYKEIKTIVESSKDHTHELSKQLQHHVWSLKLEQIDLTLALINQYMDFKPENLLKYIDLCIKHKQTNYLHAIIELYRSHEFDNLLLQNTCFKTDDSEAIVYLIDCCGVFTHDKEKLELYAKYKKLSMNDITLKLIEKVSILETMLIKQQKLIKDLSIRL